MPAVNAPCENKAEPIRELDGLQQQRNELAAATALVDVRQQQLRRAIDQLREVRERALGETT
jgi:hypothetical protein